MTLAPLSPDARLRIYSDLGVLQAGALLTTYAAGTTTPLATYSNAARTVPNTNPVVASAGGLFGPIYLTPNVAYKFVLTDALGVSIWTQDDVSVLDETAAIATLTAAVALATAATTVGTSSPTTTGTQTALALPTGTGDLILYANNATLLTVQGIAAGLAGQRLTIMSIGAGQVDFAHAHASGTALGKLKLFATSGLTSLAPGVGVATFQYDGTATVWRLVTHQQGAWITPTYAAGDYTAATGTWTVSSGAVVTAKYKLEGRTLHFDVLISGTAVSATPATLRRTLFGFTAATRQFSVCYVVDNGGTAAPGLLDMQPSDTFMRFSSTLAGASWAVAAAGTSVAAAGHVEVA